MKLYVAVIDRNPDPEPWRRSYLPPPIENDDRAESVTRYVPNLPAIARRGHGYGLATIVGTDRDAVIRHALEVKQGFKQTGLRILVGELTMEVREPVTFEEIPL